jgi:hypothetical protein
MNRGNPYEAAFAAFLRERRVEFMPVDEAKRASLGREQVKSPDFVVVGPGSVKLIVDVKGRRFPGGTATHPRMVWQNWSTADDLMSLHEWAERFGPGYRGVLAFVYRLVPPYTVPAHTPDVWAYRQEQYLIRGIESQVYRQHMRTRSPRWGTVHLTAADFRKRVQPFSAFLMDASPVDATIQQKATQDRE